MSVGKHSDRIGLGMVSDQSDSGSPTDDYDGSGYHSVGLPLTSMGARVPTEYKGSH